MRITDVKLIILIMAWKSDCSVFQIFILDLNKQEIPHTLIVQWWTESITDQVLLMISSHLPVCCRKEQSIQHQFPPTLRGEILQGQNSAI